MLIDVARKVFSMRGLSDNPSVSFRCPVCNAKRKPIKQLDLGLTEGPFHPATWDACPEAGPQGIIVAHWPNKNMGHRAARHRWYSWTLRPWGRQRCHILQSLFLEMVTWVIWRNLSCSWGIVTFSIVAFEFQVVFMSPLLAMYTRCGAFRIQVALMNQAPLETESKSTWHDYGSHRTAGLHHASIRQILIPCPFYVESMKKCVFKISDLFCPFPHHDKMQEMLCIDCKKRKHNWMPDVQINSKSADLCRSDSPWVEDDVAWPNHCMLWGCGFHLTAK